MDRRLSLDSKIKLNINPWDFYGIALLAAVTILLIPTWPSRPLFMDGYYHLSVMRGFADAGGWVGEAFWEFAPVGRPHLYPPLFHLLELALFRLGLDPIGIARVCDFAVYPIFLFALWWPMRRLFDNRLAFFFLVLLVGSAPLYLGVVGNIPSALALSASFLAYYFFRRGRFLSAWVALAGAWYIHALVSWIGAVAFLGACCFLGDREKRMGFCILAAAFAAGVPLFVHEALNWRFLNLWKAAEFYNIDISIPLMVLAVAGLVWFLRHRAQDVYFVGLLLGMLILLAVNRDRFFSGIGLVPLSFFAAVVVDRVWCVYRVWASKVWQSFFWVFFIAVFFIGTPMVRLSLAHPTPRLLMDSSLFTMTGLAVSERIKSKTIYFPRLTSRAIALLEKNSSVDDIVFSNFEYAGGMLATLAHRATSFAMLREVRPRRSFDPIAVARVVLWFKSPAGLPLPLLKEAVERYRLEEIGQTELVYLFRNQEVTAERHVIPAVIPEGVCFGLMACLAGLVLFDFFVCRKNEKKVDIIRRV